jgi:hypothetical protein
MDANSRESFLTTDAPCFAKATKGTALIITDKNSDFSLKQDSVRHQLPNPNCKLLRGKETVLPVQHTAMAVLAVELRQKALLQCFLIATTASKVFFRSPFA